MTVLTAVAAGGKWGTAATWNPAQIPAATDDCIIDGTLEAAKTVTIDTTSAKCRSLDCSLMKGKLKIEKSLAIGTTTANGTLALKFGSEGTLETVVGGVFKFISTAATELEVTCAGKNVGELLFEGNGGKWKLADKMKASEIALGRGLLNLNGQEVETAGVAMATTELTRELKMGASVVKIAGAAGAWDAGAVALTIKAETSTIEFTGIGANFKAGTYTYNTVRFTNTAATAAKIIGGPTIKTLALNQAGGTGGVQVEEATTVTITGSLTSNAKSGATQKLASTKAGTAGKFTKASGSVEGLDWLEITDNETNNAVSWFAGANSTLSGLTEFWKKEASGGTVGKLEGTGKVVFAGATAIAGRAAIAGKGPVVFAGTDTLNGRAAIAATTAVRFGQTAALGAKAAVAGTSVVAFGQAASVKARAALAATTTVRFGQKATLTAISGAKRIAGRFLFWFDEEEP